MKPRIPVLIFLLMTIAGVAFAILPPDATAREPQIRAYRQQVRKKAEERMEARRVEARRAYDQVSVDVVTPPWMRTKTKAHTVSATDTQAFVEEVSIQKEKRHILAPIVLMALIVAAAGWVRYATREIDE